MPSVGFQLSIPGTRVRAPLDIPLKTSPHGGYLYERSTGPHFGVDLLAPRGTPVLAPEPLEVLYVGDGTDKPLTGYQPGAMIAYGTLTGFYHVFGHLDGAPKFGKGDQIAAGTQLGTVGNKGHLHWEVRTEATPANDDATRRETTLNPLAWLRTGGSNDVWLHREQYDHEATTPAAPAPRPPVQAPPPAPAAPTDNTPFVLFGLGLLATWLFGRMR